MEKTFVALDNMDKDQVRQLLSDYPQIKKVKIGLELYLKYGNSIVNEIANDFNVEIFLDLKLHDIPSTVTKAISALKGLPISFLTIHASGGRKMLEAAYESAQVNLPNCQLLAVTILTSHTTREIKDIWGREYKESLNALLNEITKAQITGLVCSAQDLSIISAQENETNLSFTKVTPGIRLKNDESDDQTRIMTPEDAIKAGSNFLVVGRSITKNPNSILEGHYP
ncbi:orotidine-5'-phosphate decarboxylase [Halobacteriovorax sp. YZS-1-1]|uniref:orotidine-5'-phosphate decarboxylase n=1 Tax=unclassified Halobacteriovorax TaxID=2639665 RepID=UPI0039999493